MRTAEQRLANLKHHATLYELAITDGTTMYLVCYSDRKGRSGILGCIRNKGRGERVVALTGSETLTFAKRAADGATLGRWTINFTGRTERQAIAEGELPRMP